MYKVFINDHLIQCADLKENLQQDINQIRLYNPEMEEVLVFIRFFLEESLQAYALSLHGWNNEQLFQGLKDKLTYLIAAGGVVTFEDKFLLIHRLNKWDLPKGKMEEGEDPQGCALREVEEECNISELEIHAPLPSTFHIYKDRKGNIILKETFWFSMQTTHEGKPSPQTEEGIEAVKWMRKEEIKSVIPNTYASLKPLLTEIAN